MFVSCCILLVQESTSNPNLSTVLKEKFGGLKKFLEVHPDTFIIGKDHPFNPNVYLRASLTDAELALIAAGGSLAQLGGKRKKGRGKKKGGIDRDSDNSSTVSELFGPGRGGSGSGSVSGYDDPHSGGGVAGRTNPFTGGGYGGQHGHPYPGGGGYGQMRPHPGGGVALSKSISGPSGGGAYIPRPSGFGQGMTVSSSRWAGHRGPTSMHSPAHTPQPPFMGPSHPTLSHHHSAPIMPRTDGYGMQGDGSGYGGGMGGGMGHPGHLPVHSAPAVPSATSLQSTARWNADLQQQQMMAAQLRVHSRDPSGRIDMDDSPSIMRRAPY